VVRCRLLLHDGCLTANGGKSLRERGAIQNKLKCGLEAKNRKNKPKATAKAHADARGFLRICADQEEILRVDSPHGRGACLTLIFENETTKLSPRTEVEDHSHFEVGRLQIIHYLLLMGYIDVLCDLQFHNNCRIHYQVGSEFAKNRATEPYVES
jgi:hypothetical protein